MSQTIKDTHSYLREMMKTISVKDNVLIDLQIIGDFSYAWYHIDRFTSLMQNTIKDEPSFVIKLRATFLKVFINCLLFYKNKYEHSLLCGDGSNLV